VHLTVAQHVDRHHERLEPVHHLLQLRAVGADPHGRGEDEHVARHHLPEDVLHVVHHGAGSRRAHPAARAAGAGDDVGAETIDSLGVIPANREHFLEDGQHRRALPGVGAERGEHEGLTVHLAHRARFLSALAECFAALRASLATRRSSRPGLTTASWPLSDARGNP
jgi:hypothetical protein